MLPIILFILKLLGILVLILLGLILGVLLLILFVPVRYRIEGSYYEWLKGKVRVTWLLHIVSVTAAYEDEFSILIRLFGFRLFKPVEESREDAEEMLVHAMEVTDEDAEEFSGDILKDVERSGKKRLTEEGKLPEDNASGSERTNSEEKRKEPQKMEPQKSSRLNEEPGPGSSDQAGSVQEGSDQNSSDKEHESKKTIGGKAQAAADRLSSIFAKLKYSFEGICDKLKTIKEKKEEIQAWISNENNRKTIRLLLRQLKKLIRHLLPKKGKGEVVFGFDDPYTTGQVLTAVSAVYPFCHKQLDIYPVFDRQVFTAEGHFKGRIRAGTLLLIAGRMLLDKNFRGLLRKWLR